MRGSARPHEEHDVGQVVPKLAHVAPKKEERIKHEPMIEAATST